MSPLNPFHRVCKADELLCKSYYSVWINLTRELTSLESWRMEAANGYSRIKTSQHTGAEGSDAQTHTHTHIPLLASSVPDPILLARTPSVIKWEGCRAQGIALQAVRWHVAGFISEEEKENFAAAARFAGELLPGCFRVCALSAPHADYRLYFTLRPAVL